MTSAELFTTLLVARGGLTLRSPRADDVDALMDVYSEDFDLRPSQMRGKGTPEGFRVWQHSQIEQNRAPTSRDGWRIELVVEDGGVVGWASLAANNFTRDFEFETNSWVEPGSRGQGVGTSIRHALLALGFLGLGGQSALSRAEPSNKGSVRVSENCGYSYSGFSFVEMPDRARVMYEHFRLKREDWTDPTPAVLSGAGAFRSWLHHDPDGVRSVQ